MSVDEALQTSGVVRSERPEVVLQELGLSAEVCRQSEEKCVVPEVSVAYDHVLPKKSIPNLTPNLKTAFYLKGVREVAGLDRVSLGEGEDKVREVHNPKIPGLDVVHHVCDFRVLFSVFLARPVLRETVGPNARRIFPADDSFRERHDGGNVEDQRVHFDVVHQDVGRRERNGQNLERDSNFPAKFGFEKIRKLPEPIRKARTENISIPSSPPKPKFPIPKATFCTSQTRARTRTH